MHEDNHNESENGSVWTSYSDLFMALAVVFLILLVFALLKSGITRVKADLERKQQEDYLVKANVPEKLAKRNTQDLDTLKDTISKISEKKQVIKESLNELDQLATVLQKREKVVTRLMKDYKQKLAAVNSARKTIAKQDDQIKELKTKETDLAKEVTESSAREKRLEARLERMQQQNRELESKIASLESQSDERKKQLIVQKDTVNTLSRDLNTTSDKLERRDKQVEHQQQQISQQSNLIKELKHDLQVSRANYQGSKKESSDFSQQVEELTRQLQVTKERLAKTRTENDTLTENLKSAERTANSTQRELNQSQSEANKLRTQNANLNERVKDLSASASETSQSLAGLRKENQSLKGELAGMGKENKRLLNENNSLAGKLQALSAKSSAQAQEIGDLKAEFSKLGGKLARLGQANGELQGQVEGLQHGLAEAQADGQAKAAEIGRLRGELQGMSQGLAAAQAKGDKLANKLNMVSSQRDDVSLKLSSCTQDLAANIQDKKVKSRELSSVKSKLDKTKDAIGKIYDERKNIAGDISKALGAKGFDVTVDSTSGVVTLNMDESFYFKKNSAELSETAKEKLKSIIPIYAKSLLGSQYAKRIAGITITGFASPTYHRKFVDPETFAPEAYSYNLHLSMDRAEKIAEFIFGKEMGEYPFKDSLMQQTTVSGAGYMKPIVAKEPNRDPAQCGIYDCPKSRRVEFNFILKDKKAIDSKLLGIGAKI